jgi:hypothetical protein
MYFGVWPFVTYLFYIFNWSEQGKLTCLAALSILSVGLAVLFVRLQKNIAIPAALFSCFACLTGSAFLFEHPIKNRLASSFGFYSQEKPSRSSDTTWQKTAKTFTPVSGGYSVMIPSRWKRGIIEGTNLIYFQISNKEQVTAEFRPKCIAQSNVALPEIAVGLVMNNANGHSDKSCYTWDDNTNACLIKIRQTEFDRWRWFSVTTNNQLNIELDFIFHSSDASLRDEADQIISSLQISNIPTPHQDCPSIEEWL